MNFECDVIVYGGSAGSGKSFLELIHPLQYALVDPKYRAVFFRRNTKMLRQPGGLWDTSKQLYERFNVKTTDLKHKFESGAELTFSHMEYEANAYDHKGAQYSAIYFDELDQFTEFQFVYLMSRLRSDAQNKGYVLGT